MNLAEIITSVRAEIAESASVAIEWTDAEIIAAINEGYEEISDYTEWYERMTPIRVLARQNYFDLRGIGSSFPVLTVMRIFTSAANTSGSSPRWLKPVSVRELDGDAWSYPNYPQWEGIKAIAQYFFLRGLWWLGIHPAPSSEGDRYKLFHTSLPLPLVLSTDQPGFPVEFHLALVYYAAYEMLLKEKETGLALQKWSDYTDYATDLYAVVKGRQNIDHVLRMGEEVPLR